MEKFPFSYANAYAYVAPVHILMLMFMLMLMSQCEPAFSVDMHFTQTIYIVLCNCVTTTRLIPLRIH